MPAQPYKQKAIVREKDDDSCYVTALER